MSKSKILKITSFLYDEIYEHLSNQLQEEVPQEEIAALAKQITIRLESKLEEQAFLAVNNALSWEISDELIKEIEKIINEEIEKKKLEWQAQGILARKITITLGAGGGLSGTALNWCRIYDYQKE